MKEILDYITNNVNETTGSNVPIFPSETTVNGNVSNDLMNKLNNPTIVRILGNIFDTQNTLYYGYYQTDNYYGFIYIANSDLEEVKLITTFTSGNNLFPIIAMNQDENGYMYALSTELGNSIVGRVLLFNNILASINGEYIAKLRASYIIPNSSNLNFQLYEKNKIVKVPDEATYYLTARNSDEHYSTLIEFKINVGEENEWNTYNFDELFTLARNTILIEKESDDVKVYFYALSQSSTTPNYITNYVEYKLENGVLQRTKTISLNYLASFSVSQVLAISSNNIYISAYNSSDNYTRVYKVKGNSLLEIYSIQNSSPSYLSRLALEYVNNILFAKLTYYDGTNKKAKVGIIKDTIYFTNEYSMTNQGSFWDYVVLTTNVMYNLVEIYIPNDSTTNKIVLDYNPNNYNGLEYSSYNELVPTKSRLYSNNKLVFARNLYNNTLLGATTTSTVQVSNTLLNNAIITQNNLIGATNKTLMTDTTNITKNIYESLYINFIRTLSVIDEDEEKLYPNTATYINQNINIGTKQNCEQSFVGKVQVVYESNTITQNLNWNYNLDHYETEFTIDATQEVPKLVFMSNDLTTIYLEKELDVQVGSYYIISQKLRIE